MIARGGHRSLRSSDAAVGRPAFGWGRFWRLRLMLAGAVASMFVLTAAAGAATWSVSYPPYPAASSVPFAPLNSITAVSPNLALTVGESSGVALVDSWNGLRWTTSQLPSGPCSQFEADCALTGVSGDSASDVIAVGHGTVPSVTGWLALPLAFHFNGTGWSAMALPSGLPYEAVQHVAAFGSTDAWAVGVGSTSSGATTVNALQWNGTSWNSVATSFTTVNNLNVNAISGSSPTDVWVVGQTVTPGYHNRKFTSVALHYDGLSWQQESIPDGSGLLDIATLSPTDAWAVAADGSILNWNGSSWSAKTQESGAERVVALSAADVWVGGILSIGHFNGSAWSTTTTPSTASGIDQGVAVAPGRVWFAGYYYQPGTTEVPMVLSTSNG